MHIKSFLKKRLELTPAIALLVACALSSACMAWHTTSLEPRRFSADTSPERARLTLSDGREVTARHPVIVGDSLAWADGSRGSSPGAAWNAVPVSSVWRVKERRLDAPRTFLLLAVLGGLALGVRALYIGYVNAID